MTKTLLATVAVAAIALAGCAKEEKMMKDTPTVGNAAAPNEPVSGTGSGAGESASSGTVADPVTYSAPSSSGDAMAADATGGDAMMDLCFDKGGQIGEWPGADGGTKTCRAADGSEYPLASLSSYEAFQ